MSRFNSLESAVSVHSSSPALQLGALNDYIPLPRHLPFDCVTNFLHGLLLIYRPRKDERLSWPHWLSHGRQFTHKVVTCPTISQAPDREVKERSTTVLRCQQSTLRPNSTWPPHCSDYQPWLMLQETHRKRQTETDTETESTFFSTKSCQLIHVKNACRWISRTSSSPPPSLQ